MKVLTPVDRARVPGPSTDVVPRAYTGPLSAEQKLDNIIQGAEWVAGPFLGLGAAALLLYFLVRK